MPSSSGHSSHTSSHSSSHHSSGGFHSSHYIGGGYGRYNRSGNIFTLIFGIIWTIISLPIFIMITFLTSSLDEDLYQNKALSYYSEVYSPSSDLCYEDNLLVYILATSEDNYEFNYLAMMGDNISGEVRSIFSDSGYFFSNFSKDVNNRFTLGEALSDSISLSDSKVKNCTNKLKMETGTNNYECKIINNTDYVSITYDMNNLNSSLNSFKEDNSIALSIVIDDVSVCYTSYFDISSSLFILIFVIIGVVLIITSIVGMIKGGKRNKPIDNTPDYHYHSEMNNYNNNNNYDDYNNIQH